MRVARAPRESELEDVHPGQAERMPEPLDGRRDDAEVLGDEREMAELRLQGVEEAPSRAAPPASPGRRPRAGRNRPVRDEAAEVVDPRGIDELERPAEPLAPPAVAV